MKASEIQVGGCYKAKVSGKLVTVRVDAIEDVPQRSYRGTTFGTVKNFRARTSYQVTNLSTGRKTVFHSAMKFRYAVEKPVEFAVGNKVTTRTDSREYFIVKLEGEVAHLSPSPAGELVTSRPIHIQNLLLAPSNKVQTLHCVQCHKTIVVEGHYTETGEELCQKCDPAYAHQRDNKHYVS